MSSEQDSRARRPFFQDPKKLLAIVVAAVVVIAGVLAGFYYLPEDWDGDGIPNAWEERYGLNPRDPSDAALDADSDGYDSDRDGTVDREESFTNKEEYLNGTDPRNKDTDGDGIHDGWEVWFEFDPLDDTDGASDPDEDMLMNVGEFNFGTPPRTADVDMDFLLDSGEVGFGTDPYSPDSDGDGLLDSVELFDYFAYDSIKVKEELRMWMEPIKRILRIEQDGHYRLKIPFNGVLFNPRVLVVNDDKFPGDEEFGADIFASRLAAVGLRPEMADSTRLWDIDLQDYDFVVWSSGDDPNPVPDPLQRQLLIDFVLTGGRLLIEGGHFSAFAWTDPAFGDFVLHAIGLEDGGSSSLIQILDHPVSAGFAPNESVPLVSYLGPDADAFFNITDPLTGIDSKAVFRWQGFSDYGLNTYDDDLDATNGGQIIYMSFDITEIQDSTQLYRLVDNSISWLNPFPSDTIVNMTRLMEALDIVVRKKGVEVPHTYDSTIISNATRYLSAGYSEIYSFWLRSYDLETGIYSVSIDLNESSILEEVPEDFNFTVFLSYILAEKLQLDPLVADVDGDGIPDGDEVAIGTYPLNDDSDHDELTDSDEWYRFGTSPLNSDSDGDMLPDGLELGIVSDADRASVTDPLDFDTDDDGLYDGWFDENGDEIFSPSEMGEDVDQDGRKDLQETDPLMWSTDRDNLPDGWEVRMHLNPLSATGADGDMGNPDVDLTRYGSSFTNVMEFNLGTNPKPYDWDGDGAIVGGFESGKDYDGDGLQDGQEAFVLLRTSVRDGAESIENYAAAEDWIYFDQNVTDGLPGAAYLFDSVERDVESTSPANARSPGVEGAFRLVDGTRIFYDRDLDRIYVWEPFSDFLDRDATGILEGTFYVFVSSSAPVVSSDLPAVGFQGKEIYWGISPFIPDSDFDGLLDGKEALYDQDTDWDGRLNALDLDSDNDGITDFVEQTVYPNTDMDNDGLENMVDLDSDGDGIPDDKEQRPFVDTDTDSIINLLDKDSDDDGLADGEEDVDADGFTDANEPSPLIVDTDADGLTDHEEVVPGVDGYITDPADEDTDDDGLLDGVEVAGWNITVNGFIVHVSADPTLRNRDGDLLTDDLEYLFTDPMSGDTDVDFLLDGQEDANLNGRWDPGETNPTDSDTDDDLLLDGIEVGLRTSPLDADSDDDMLIDGIEDTDKDGFTDIGETDPASPDSDGDGLLDGVEDRNRNGAYDTSATSRETDPLNPDSDGDGLPDGTERAWDGDTDGDGWINARDQNSDGDALLYDGWVDLDGDALYDPGEGEDFNRNGAVDPDISGDPRYDPLNPVTETDPLDNDQDDDGLITGIDPDDTNPDVDGDGLLDGTEDANHNGVWDGLGSGETDLWDPDTDGDGLSDFDEVMLHGTNPLDTDSDSDNLVDYEEVNIGADGYITDPLDTDSDDDGLNDAEEAAYFTNPNDPDTEGDGIPDEFEARWASFTGLDPLNGTDSTADFDSDGLTNLEEYELGEFYALHDFDGDTIWNIQDNDDDGDGMPTAWELEFNLTAYDAGDQWQDKDGDSRANWWEYIDGTNPTLQDTDGDYLADDEWFFAGTDPLDKDSDDDGLLDGVEYNGWIVFIIRRVDDIREFSVTSDPTRINSDGDLLTDYDEFVLGTNPRHRDTDGDGLFDHLDPAPLIVEFNSPSITDFTISVDVHISLEPIYERVKKTVTETVWNVLTFQWDEVVKTTYEWVVTGYREVLDWVKVRGTFKVEDDETTLDTVRIDINGNVKVHQAYANVGWFSHEVDIGNAIWHGFDAKVRAWDSNDNSAEFRADIPGVADALDAIYDFATQALELLLDLGEQALDLLRDGALWVIEQILRPAFEALLSYIQTFAGVQSRFLAPYLDVNGALRDVSGLLNESVNELEIPGPVELLHAAFKVAADLVANGLVTAKEVLSLAYDILRPGIQQLPIPQSVKDMSDQTVEWLLDLAAEIAVLVDNMNVATLQALFNSFIDEIETLTGIQFAFTLPDLSSFLTWPEIFDPSNYDLLVSGVNVPSGSVLGVFVTVEVAITIPFGEGPGEEVTITPAFSFYITDAGIDAYLVLATPTTGPSLDGPIDFGLAFGDRDRRQISLGYGPISFAITDIEDTPVDVNFTELVLPYLSYSWALFSFDWP